MYRYLLIDWFICLYTRYIYIYIYIYIHTLPHTIYMGSKIPPSPLFGCLRRGYISEFCLKQTTTACFFKHNNYYLVRTFET